MKPDESEVSLLDELLAGCSEQERDAVLGARELSERQGAWDAEAGLVKAMGAIRNVQSQGSQESGSYWAPWRKWVGYSSIACVGLILLVNLLSVYNVPSKSDKQTTYTTRLGQRAHVRLGDGSEVILAPGTTLIASGPDNRQVELTGEAVFTVNANSNNPFIVKAGKSTTRVLGTTFSVRAYPTGESVRVAVAVGRVSMGSSILSAGDVAVLAGNANEPLVKNGTDISSAFVWTSGRLVFNKTPLPQLTEELERWYNVKFVLADAKLSNSYVTTSLGTQSLEEVLRILSVALNARVERTSSVVTLYTR